MIVLVFGFLYVEVDLVILFTVVLVEWVVCWNLVADLLSQDNAGLVCPTSAHVLYCVASAAE